MFHINISCKNLGKFFSIHHTLQSRMLEIFNAKHEFRGGFNKLRDKVNKKGDRRHYESNSEDKIRVETELRVDLA